MLGQSISVSLARQASSPLHRPRRDLSVISENDFTLSITVYQNDSDATPLDITGATLSWRVFDGADDPVIDVPGALTVAASGECEVEVAGTLTTNRNGRYSHTLRVDFSDGSAALLTGVLNIEPNDGSLRADTSVDAFVPNTDGVFDFGNVQSETVTATSGDFDNLSANDVEIQGSLTVGVLNAGTVAYTTFTTETIDANVLKGTTAEITSSTQKTIGGTDSITFNKGLTIESGPLLTPGWSGVFMDGSRRFVGGFRKDGEFRAKKAELQTLTGASMTMSGGITGSSLTVTNATIAGDQIIRNSLVPGWSWVFTDPDGNITGGIKKTGLLKFKNIEAENLTLTTSGLPTLIPSLKDSDQDAAGYVARGITRRGLAVGRLRERDVARAVRQTVRPTTLHTYIPPRTAPDASVTSGDTIATLWTADSDFDWVRICVGQQSTGAVTATAVIAATSSANDGVNPLNESGGAGTWTTVTWNNLGSPNFDPWNQNTGSITSATLVGSADTQVWGLTYSDWMQVSSLAQIAGSAYPLLMARVRLVGAPVAVDISSSSLFGLTPETATFGRTWAAYRAAGDYVSSTAGYPNSGTTWGDRWAPLFIQTYSRKFGIQTWGCGDSNMAGTGSTDGMLGFFRRSVLRANAHYPTIHGNFNQAGSSPEIYMSNVENIIDAVRPGILVIFPFSFNMAATRANLDHYWGRAMNMVARVTAYGGVPILVGYPPRSTATSGDDDIRKLGLARLAAAAASGIRVVDPNPLVSDAGAPDTWKAWASDDGTHFSNAGHAVTADLLAAEMIDAIGD